MKKSLFTYLLLFSALTISGIGAWFSVTGIAQFYSGAKVQMIFAASALELGKIFVAILVHRYWKKFGQYKIMGNFLRVFYSFGLIVLMGVTSWGIFAYMTNAYQTTTIQIDKITQEKSFFTQKLDIIKDRNETLTFENNELIKDINFLRTEKVTQLEGIPTTWITKRLEITRHYDDLIKEKQEIILSNKQKIVINQVETDSVRIATLELDNTVIESGGKIGPIITLSRMFGWDTDTIALIFTTIIVLVFDPLAIAMIIGWNIAIDARIEIKSETEPNPKIETKTETEPKKIVNDEKPEEKKTIIKGNKSLLNILQPFQQMPKKDQKQIVNKIYKRNDIDDKKNTEKRLYDEPLKKRKLEWKGRIG